MSTAQQPPPPSRPATTSAHRPGRRWARALLTLLVLAATLLGLLWGWAGSEGSLATTLRLAARQLPADLQLQAQDVTGTLRGGGRLGVLRLHTAALDVEVQDARVAWQLAPLLQGRLVLTELQARRIALTPQDQPEPAPETGEPLQELILPLQVSLPFASDEILWNAGSETPFAITGLRGHYAWDGSTHHLQIDHLALAQGSYQLQATLQGAAPMALQAALQGSVLGPVPGSDAPLNANAQAQAQGTLAGHQARLDITAELQGEAGNPLQARAEATLAPWAAQPLLQAGMQLQALDLAALWPQAPATQLTGSLSLQPQELPAQDGWALQADFTNKNAGPWDAHRLPITALQLRADYAGTLLTVPDASIHVGQGLLRLQGLRYDQADGELQAQLALRALDPAQLHTQIDIAPIGGSAQVRGQLHGALQIAAELTGAQRTRRPTLEHLRLDGQWQAGTLRLKTFSLAALQARIDAQDLRLDTTTRAGRGQITATLPGASLRLDGALSEHSGKGQLQLALKDAQALQQWLAKLPLPPLRALPPQLTQAQLAGQGELQVRWQGGWQAALAQATHTGQAGSAAPAFTLQADLLVPRLAWTPPGGKASDTLALRKVEAHLSGSLAQASFTLDGNAEHGAQATRLAASTHLRASMALHGKDTWQVQLRELVLQARQANRPGPWTLQLQSPLTLQLTPAPGLQLQAGAAQARIEGPQPGTATLRWEASELRQTDQGLRLTSRGSLEGVPLAWANAADSGQPPLLERLNLSGDLLLGATWDVALAEQLRVHAMVRRQAGDLQMEIDGQRTAAGLQQAEVVLDAQDSQARLGARWQTKQAGEASAQASVALQHGAQGWQIATDAPLAGELHASLPDVGVWSIFAPPGWRVRGSLGADLALAGRLNDPQLSGQISADGLALRSVLDGVDLQDGRLRAQLQGDRLTLTEFTIAGGSGSGARINGPSGNLTRAPSDGGKLSASGSVTWKDQAVRMDMAAHLSALQLLVRADRQLSVSGDLRARLQDGQLALTGQLSTDRASILLPDDSAPALGDDVVVHASGGHFAQTDTPAPQAAPAHPPKIDIALKLGDDFAVQGHGLTTRLQGELTLTSSGAQGPMPRVLGEIRTVQGRYRAWGQMLDVETGLLRFSGAMDNPQLDILALRPQISQRVGVQVSGSAQAPRVRLYAEPDLPDAEKLSWLVLGRSAAAGGADAALMQQAALALLSGGKDTGGNIAQRLGLDEIGFRGASAQNGDNAATGAALTLGKRLSRDLYVTYEHSLAGTVGALSIFLDLSKHLTLRGQTGVQSALDLIYTLRYD